MIADAGVAMDAAGNWVAVSASPVGGTSDVYFQKFGPTGITAIGGLTRANADAAGAQVQPAAAMDSAGNLTVAWATGSGVVARRFDAAGAPLTGDTTLSGPSPLTPNYPSVAVDGAGRAVVAWTAGNPASGLWDVVARRLDATGAPAGPETVAATTNGGGPASRAAVAVNDAGAALVTWTLGTNVFGQLYDAAGAPSGLRFRTNVDAAAAANQAPAAVHADGSMVIAWESADAGGGAGTDRGVVARRFDQYPNPAAAGDLVFTDANGDGVQQTTETGVDGVTVLLLEADGTAVASTVTANGGRYLFPEVRPGRSYVLQFAAPSGRGFTGMDLDGSDALDSDVDPFTGRTAPFLAVAGVADTSRDAGLVSLATINGSLFDDANGDGVKSAAEPGLAGWYAFADYDADGTRDANEPSAYTGATGAYSIPGVLPGTRTIAVDVRTGWTITTPPRTVPVPGPTVAAIGARTTGAFMPIGPVGSETRVNTTTADDQQAPQVAIAGDGSSMVVWESDGQDGSGWGIYGQVFAPGGAPTGGEFRINQSTSGDQRGPRVAVDAAGNYTVVWTSTVSNNADVYARRFGPSGAPSTGEVRANATTANSQVSPAVAVDAAGNAVIAWASNLQDGSQYGVYLRRLDPTLAALTGEVLVPAVTAGSQEEPAVAIAPTGTVVVAWSSVGTILARQFTAAGAPAGPAFQVSEVAGGQIHPSAAAFADGRFVVAWSGTGYDGSGNGILVRRYRASGSPEGREEVANTVTAQNQFRPVVHTDADGQFLVAWEGDQKDGPTSTGLGLRRFDAAGRPSGIELQPNVTTAFTQADAAMAIGPAGEVVVVWNSFQDGDRNGVYVQRFTRVVNGASAGDHVWTDGDGDGRQEATESGRDGAVVRVYSQYGLLVDQATTANGGRFLFQNLHGNASYYIEVGPTASLIGTRRDQGGDDALDSDVDPVTLRTATFALAPGQVDLTRDAGLVAPASVSGVAYNDRDAGGTRDATEPGIAGWQVFLDANDNGLLDAGERSTTTSATGAYSFTGVVLGTYAVRVVPDGAWVQTTPGADLRPDLQFGLTLTDLDVGFRFPARVARAWGPSTVVGSDGTAHGAPAVSFDAAGNYVAVWQHGSGEVRARRYDAAGNPLGAEFRVPMTGAAGGQTRPAVALLPGGGVVVAWESSAGDGNGKAVFARRFDAAGNPLGNDFLLNAQTDGDQSAPTVAALSGGGFVAAWRSRWASATDSIYVRAFDAAGLPVTAEMTANDLAWGYGSADAPSVASAPDGSYVVTFAQAPFAAGGGGDDDGLGVFARAFSGAHVRGGLGQVNQFTAGAQAIPVIASAGAGGYVVAWRSDGQDGDQGGIFARRLDAAGAPVGAEVRANAFTAGAQDLPAIAAEADGSFLVQWASSASGRAGIYTQRFDPTAQRVGGELLIDFGGLIATAVGAAPTGGAFVALFPASGGLRAQRFEQFASPAVLGGTVWTETDGDGIREAGEAPRAGVTVRVYTAAGLLVDTLTTSANGTWQSGDLKPGLSYYAEFVRPSGFALTRADRGANDAVDSDADPHAARTAPVALAAGQLDFTRDAGVVAAGSIFGAVFQDLDSDGFADAGDAPLADWTVFVDTNLNGVFDAGEAGTVTSASGAYAFSDLTPGLNRVVVAPQARWTRTTPAVVLDVTLAVGQTRLGLDVGQHTDVPTVSVAPVGVATRAHATSTLAQTGGTVARDAAGNFVVAYADAANSGDVRVQRFDPAGNAVGAVIVPHAATTGWQDGPDIAAAPGGRFVVTWVVSPSFNVYTLMARAFLADGQPAGPEVTVSPPGIDRHATDVDVSPDGSFVIAWQAPGTAGDGTDVFVRRFDPTGTPLGPAAAPGTTPGEQKNAQVDVNSAGQAIVTWASQVATNTWAVFAQRYAANGSADGAPFRLDVGTDSVAFTSVGLDAAGGFVAVWNVYDLATETSKMFLRRFDADDVPQGAPSQVTTNANSLQLVVNDAGSFVVLWRDTGGRAWVRYFNAAGLPQGSQRADATSGSVTANTPDVAIDASGDVVVAWTQSNDVYFQRFDAFAELVTVSGTVWNDTNGNGIRDAGESGRDGVTVELFNATGTRVGFTTSAGDGKYAFASQRPDTAYTLRVGPPVGLVVSARDRGADDALDSDVDPRANALAIPPITVAQGTVVVDAGVTTAASVAGTRFIDVDGDGVRGANEPGLVGALVWLDDNDNGLLDPGERSAVTADDVTYAFAGLTPQAYRLLESAQDRWTITTPLAARTLNLAPGQSLVGVDVGARTTTPARPFVPVGDVVDLRQTGLGYGLEPHIAATPGGGYVAVWLQPGPSSSQNVVFRRFDAVGNPLGPVTTVRPEGGGVMPRVAVDPVTGNFLVVVSGTGTGGAAYAHLYAADGTPLAPEREVGAGPYGRQAAVYALPAGGGYVIAWATTAGAQTVADVVAVRVSATGQVLGGPLRANVAPNASGGGDPVVVGDATGRALVAWRNSADDAFRGRWLTADGQFTGGEVTLGTGDGAYRLAMLPSGEFAVVRATGSNAYLSRFNAAGARQGAEFRVNHLTVRVESSVAVALDPAGNVLVTYSTGVVNETVQYVRTFSAAGVPIGPPLVAAPAPGYTSPPAHLMTQVAATAGGFAVTWAGVGVRFFLAADPGDADGNGTVALNDLVILANHYGLVGGQTWADGDFDGNGTVGLNDLVILANNYGKVLAAPAPAPDEPATDEPVRGAPSAGEPPPGEVAAASPGSPSVFPPDPGADPMPTTSPAAPAPAVAPEPAVQLIDAPVPVPEPASEPASVPVPTSVSPPDFDPTSAVVGQEPAAGKPSAPPPPRTVTLLPIAARPEERAVVPARPERSAATIATAPVVATETLAAVAPGSSGGRAAQSAPAARPPLRDPATDTVPIPAIGRAARQPPPAPVAPPRWGVGPVDPERRRPRPDDDVLRHTAAPTPPARVVRPTPFAVRRIGTEPGRAR